MLYNQTLRVEAEPMTFGEAKILKVINSFGPKNDDDLGYAIKNIPYDGIHYWEPKEFFEQRHTLAEGNKDPERSNLKARKLEAIELAIRCPGITSGNLIKTANDIMEFLKQE